jgi:hypothetical protein
MEFSRQKIHIRQSVKAPSGGWLSQCYPWLDASLSHASWLEYQIDAGTRSVNACSINATKACHRFAIAYGTKCWSELHSVFSGSLSMRKLESMHAGEAVTCARVKEKKRVCGLRQVYASHWKMVSTIKPVLISQWANEQDWLSCSQWNIVICRRLTVWFICRLLPNSRMLGGPIHVWSQVATDVGSRSAHTRMYLQALPILQPQPLDRPGIKCTTLPRAVSRCLWRKIVNITVNASFRRTVCFEALILTTTASWWNYQ